jgi:hypothetical protein
VRMISVIGRLLKKGLRKSNIILHPPPAAVLEVPSFPTSEP